MFVRALLGTAVLLVATSACDPDTVLTPAPNAAVSVNVAPLQLAGVGRADYAISVTSSAGPVWSQDHVDSDRYGDGRGSISYVGPCDASTPAHTVTLVLNALYDENDGLIAATSYRNPTPISLPVTCLPNRDVPVSFDLVILRDARQGFFDIAVNFADLFCSAKLDCEDDAGNDLFLLHKGDGSRGTTLVLAFACTAGPEADVDTWLYLDDLVVDCTNDTFDAEVDPSLGPGTVTPTGNAGGLLFGAAVYRGEELIVSKGYWNVALGLDTTKFAAAGTCRLTTRGTASDGPFVDNTPRLGATWPVITWDEQIVADGQRVCDQNAVNVTGSGVQTVYSDPAAPQAFDHGFERGSSTVVTPGLCGDACAVSSVEPAAGVATTGGQVVLRGVFSPNDPTCADCDLQLVPGGTSLPATFDVAAGTVTFTAPAGATDFTVALVVGLELIPLRTLVVGPDGLLTNQATTSIPVPRRTPTVTRVSGCIDDEGNAAVGCSVAGGERLTIVGTDFGPSAAGVTVTVGGLPCTGVAMVTPHGRLQCSSPAGTGFDREVVVTVAGRPSSPGSLSYFGPLILDDSLTCDSGCTVAGSNPTVATFETGARIRFQTRFAGADASAITATLESGAASFPCGDLAIESANPVTQIQVLSCTLDPAAVGSDLHLRIAVGPLTSR
ncbi:MAG: IPT/TIG domain-containing protein, partial [Deltaproteobacteria bacterium]|nr:IPT/TIG domain-containing protein [Deltaproteobacteria bacterium]